MDEDTLDVSDPSVRTERTGLGISIAWHPELSRVGELAWVGARRASIGRKEPSFRAADGTAAPLELRAVSRAPITIEKVGGEVRVRRNEHQASVEIDGVPLERELALDPSALEAGVVIELARRAVLVVRERRAPLLEPAALELGAERVAPASVLIGVSAGMDALREQIRRVADLDVSVLLTGGSGTGKELVARALVAASARRAGPFVAVNLAATPASVAASELFGHERGAFTGADRARRGLFEAAHGGTLFLDEIGDAPSEVQVALLRVLETGEVRPLGGGDARRVDVRVIAATDVDLESAAQRGSFREALLQRLAGYRIVLPPLSERREDVGPLLARFAIDEARALGLAARVDAPRERAWIPAGLVARLVRLPWRGNVRQLRNVVRQLVISSRDRDPVTLDPVLEQLLELGPSAPAAAITEGLPEDDEALLAILRRYRFELRRAARELGVSRSTLYARIEKSSLIRKARDLDAAEIEAARAASESDVVTMAERLEVSPRGLVLRMRELGIEP